MKHFLTLLLLLSPVFTFTTQATPVSDTEDLTLAAPVDADHSAAEWKVFSKNLLRAMTSDNEGLKVSAMQHMITYGEVIDVGEARVELMRIYRNHEDTRVRRMAVVALASMHDPGVMQYLHRAERFEPASSVRKTIHAVLADYHTAP